MGIETRAVACKVDVPVPPENTVFRAEHGDAIVLRDDRDIFFPSLVAQSDQDGVIGWARRPGLVLRSLALNDDGQTLAVPIFY